ncbi:butyrate kinase [Bacillus sp. FJAT-45350]|uniref:butyrate kinase n=1 Tax=Bacillus sp. FJAT-45350 TaxID=2011014 RepID=UPI000BB83E97|nr:butyrate kinase [Bacillus sp. FJAT-45350]
MNALKILAINPGSTSTKLAIYHGEIIILNETIRHKDEELAGFSSVIEQKGYRMQQLEKLLVHEGHLLEEFDGIVGRGGFLSPLKSGTYIVNNEMIHDLETAKYGEHASNLGAIIAYDLASSVGIAAFIVDPIVVDELTDMARLSGIPELERKSHLHALNIKAVSRKVANTIGRPYECFNFIVAHIGGGISIAAMEKGRIIDVNNGNNEGPYSPERAGGLPSKELIHLCYSGQFTEKEMISKVTKEGGLYAYLGTKSVIEAEERAIQGDIHAQKILEGMIYQLAKEIGAMSTVVNGEIDGIILTGGVSYSEFIINRLRKKIQFLAPVFVQPGEEELEALAFGALRVLSGEEEGNYYQNPN